MTWTDVFNTLAWTNVTGVNQSYTLDTRPDTISTDYLPVLVPTFPEGTGLSGRDERGLATLSYEGDQWRSVMHVDHLLLVGGVWGGRGLGYSYQAVDMIDDYLTAMTADATFGGLLAVPLEIVHIVPGLLAYGGVTFHGVRFRHRWVRVV